MNVTVNSKNLTEETFRNSDTLRDGLRNFIEGTTSGSALLFLLREKAKIKSRTGAVPHEAIATYSVAELSRLAGIQEAIDLITNLCDVPAQQPNRSIVQPLGVYTEKELPPKFEVSTPTPKTP